MKASSESTADDSPIVEELTPANFFATRYEDPRLEQLLRGQASCWKFYVRSALASGVALCTLWLTMAHARSSAVVGTVFTGALLVAVVCVPGACILSLIWTARETRRHEMNAGVRAAANLLPLLLPLLGGFASRMLLGALRPGFREKTGYEMTDEDEAWEQAIRRRQRAESDAEPPRAGPRPSAWAPREVSSLPVLHRARRPDAVAPAPVRPVATSRAAAVSQPTISVYSSARRCATCTRWGGQRELARGSAPDFVKVAPGSRGSCQRLGGQMAAQATCDHYDPLL